MPTRPAALPHVLARRSTDEFEAPPYTRRDRQALARVLDRSVSAPETPGDRTATAAGLLALNEACGVEYYRVPGEAARDREAAADALGGDEVVIDVQTHFVSDRPECGAWNTTLRDLYRRVAPSWWRGIDDVTAYHMAEYLRCVFLESETAVAVLTSAPGLGPDRMLFNRELEGVRALTERLGPPGRLLNHAVVHPDVDGEVGAMERMRDAHRPAGWKVYTLVGSGPARAGWWLDDEASGVPFLERARELGVRRICAHKGISQLVPTGSPRDVGPVAAVFPELDFLIYHSAYEMPAGEAPEEGPYTPDTANRGTNRLVTTLREHGVAAGSNVYAELGSTWFSLIRRPEEAAHVLGKLLLAVGEGNVLWGTDAIWYGSAQPAIDAFRAFQIPAELRERFGYPELTPGIKAGILGANAARVYGIDLEQARRTRDDDDLAWIRSAVAEYRAKGVPGSD